jgi:mRNA interferase MazF
MAERRLLKPSAIKPVLATLEQSLVIRLLGRLTEGDRTALRQAIGDTLG